MCILCTASRWSRRIVATLPWLIVPLIILWALSQFLPPGFRFEVTSSRLGCLGVLLLCLGWYDLGLPRVSAWRAQRGALEREKRRLEAIEEAKWRKEATRRCRNCLTAYRDQAPGGGKFTCLYCGHVSKRPVLDLPGSDSGSLFAGSLSSNLMLSRGRIGTGGRNLERWGERGGGGVGGGLLSRPSWVGGGWSIAATTVNGSWLGSPSSYLGSEFKNWGVGGCSFGQPFVGERFVTTESYSGFLSLAFRFLYHMFSWVLMKIWRVGRSDERMSGGHRPFPRKPFDENGLQESRAEKARRKAEEKRQARMEKELLEEEERKQREEVARLVEERRRLRDEKLEAEKESEKQAAAEREREMRREREAEKRRQEKSRERERGLADDAKKKKGKEDDKKEESKASVSSNGGESRKNTKSVKASGPESSLKMIDLVSKSVPMSAIKTGGMPNLGSAKSGTFSPVKSSSRSLWTRGLSTGSAVGAKAGKAGPSSSSSGKVTEVSTSAWNRISWRKVWGKGLLAGENDQNIPGVIEGANSSVDQKSFTAGMDSTVTTSTSGLSSSGVKMPLSPIAPPSSQTKSWLGLFSNRIAPSATESSPAQHLETGAECLDSSCSSPHPIHFGTVDPVGILPCEFNPQVVSLPGVTSDPVISSVPMPNASFLPEPHLDLHKTEETNAVDLQDHDPISLLGPVSEALLSGFGNDLRMNISPSIKFDPLSPIHSPMKLPSPCQSQASAPFQFGEMNSHLNSSLLSQNLGRAWGSSSSSLLDDPNAVSNEGRWQLWGDNKLGQIDLPSLILPPVDGLLECERNLSESLSSTTLHSQLEPEVQLPTSLFSPEQKSSFVDQRNEEYLGRVPTSSNNCIWSDPLALESTRWIWQDTENQDRVPPEFLDFITGKLMKDPVIIADGFSYERSSIEEWLKSNETSPRTSELLPRLPGDSGVDKTLRPNHILRGQIIEYKEKLARDMMLLQEGSLENGWSGSERRSSKSSSPSWLPKMGRPPSAGGYYSSSEQSLWSYKMP